MCSRVKVGKTEHHKPPHQRRAQCRRCGVCGHSEQPFCAARRSGQGRLGRNDERANRTNSSTRRSGLDAFTPFGERADFQPPVLLGLAPSIFGRRLGWGLSAQARYYAWADERRRCRAMARSRNRTCRGLGRSSEAMAGQTAPTPALPQRGRELVRWISFGNWRRPASARRGRRSIPAPGRF